MSQPTVQFRADQAPRHMTLGAAGLDLPANRVEKVNGEGVIDSGSALFLDPGERARIGTGVQVAIPEGYEGQIRPRSGMADDSGITVLNSPGTVDADYRGEIKVILINQGLNQVIIERGDRIAQFVIVPVAALAWEAVDELPSTDRGDGGFGSTGT